MTQKLCTVEGCDRVFLAKQKCRLHYQRVKLTGTTDPPLKKDVCGRGHQKTEKNTYYYFDKKKNRMTRSCRLCAAEREKLRESNVENQIRRRDLRYQRLYGITYDEAESMANEQEYKCAICKIPCTFETKGRGGNGSFALDHCHNTLFVRGFLCHRCNKVLGLVKDDTNLLYDLAIYLQRFSIKERN